MPDDEREHRHTLSTLAVRLAILETRHEAMRHELDILVPLVPVVDGLKGTVAAINMELSGIKASMSNLQVTLQSVDQTVRDSTAREAAERAKGQAERKRREDRIDSFLKYIAAALVALLILALGNGYNLVSNQFKSNLAGVVGLVIVACVGGLLLIALRGRASANGGTP